MPPRVFHPILNTVEVVATAMRDGKVRKNVFHYNYGGAPRPSGSDLAALVGELETSLFGITGVPNNTCVGTLWNEIQARDIHDAGGALYVAPEAIPGIWADNAMMSNVSHVLTKRTGVPGISHRGRWYLFDLGRGGFDNDQLSYTLIARWLAMCAHIAASRVGGRFKPAVGSRLLGYSTLITSVTFDMISDSQYRRLAGRGA